MNKYKKLIDNTIIFAVGQMGAKVVSFLLITLYTAVLSPNEYSTADLLYNTINVLYPIVTFSMADAILRFGVDKEYNIKKVYNSANFMLVIGMTIFAMTLPIWNMVKLYDNYVTLLFFYCLFSCVRQLAAQYSRAAGFVKVFAADGVISVFLQFLCNLLFMVALDMGINGYILSFIIADLFSTIFHFTASKIYKIVSLKYIDKKLIREMLRYSLPLVPTYLLWWITSASDRIFVIEMVSEKANGVYAASYKLPTLLLLLTTMFYQAWQLSSIEEKDSKDLAKFFRNVYKIYSALMFTASAFLILFAKPITDLLLSGDKYAGAEKYTVILIISMIFQCFCQFLSSIYSVKKKSKNSCYTALSAAVTNIILNLILIPFFDVYGAAVATAASYFVCFIIRLKDTRKYIYFAVNISQIVVNTILVIAMSAIFIVQPDYYIAMLIGLFVALVSLNIHDFYGLLAGVLNSSKFKRILGRK